MINLLTETFLSLSVSELANVVGVTHGTSVQRLGMCIRIGCIAWIADRLHVDRHAQHA